MADRTADLDLLLGTAQHTKTYPRGRVCAHEGCTTVLSVYNPEGHCATHRPDTGLTYHGYSFAICTQCEEVVPAGSVSTAGRCPRCSGVRRRIEPRPDYWDGHKVKCPVCGKARDLTHANWSMRSEGTRTYQCRVCERAARRRRYEEQRQLALKTTTTRNRHKESV